MLRSASSKGKLSFSPNRLDAVAALGLFGIALGVRLPFLTLIPSFWNSELGEALDAAEIALGQSLPLIVPGQPHLGPVAIYPLALVLRVGGLDPFTPRLFAAVAGALCAVATLLLGRAVGARGGAVLAGLLVATNALHILINSHIFWTNSLTPLFSTLALTALVLSLQVERVPRPLSRRGWFLLAVFLWGLALQSHPSVWTLLPGIGLGVMLDRRARLHLREAWSWLAPLAFVLAIANLFGFNLATGFASLVVLRAKSYALPEAGTLWQNFPERLRDFAVELLRVLSSNLPATFTLDGATLTVAVWFALALWLGLKQRQTLLFYPMLSAALLLALGNKAYNLGYAERYIMFLLPLASVLMGLAAEEAWHWLRRMTMSHVLRTALALAGIIALAWWIVQPLVTLRDYYDGEMRSGRSNAAYLAGDEVASRYAGSGYAVLLDPELKDYQVVLNASDIGSTLAYLFKMHGLETQSGVELTTRIPGGTFSGETFLLPLAQSGFEERGQHLVICVVRDSTARRLFVFPVKNNECPG